MINILRISSVVTAILVLSACTSFPTGPGMLVLPGTGKSFDQFPFDEADCKQYASSQIGGTTVNEAATDSGVRSAVVGTVIGAAAGALIGGRSSTGVGAGTGLLFGSVAGAGEGSGRNLQQRYDFAYQQCMYAKGHRVPLSGCLDYSRQPLTNRNYVSSRAHGGSLLSASAGISMPTRNSAIPSPPPEGFSYIN